MDDDRNRMGRALRRLPANLWRFVKVLLSGLPWHSRHDQMELQLEIERGRQAGRDKER